MDENTEENTTISDISGEPVETVAVYAAPDGMTAEIIRGMLQGEGIDAVIGEQVTAAYNAPFAVAEGFWGEVRVPADQAEAARAILAEYETGMGISDEEIAAEAESVSDPEV